MAKPTLGYPSRTAAVLALRGRSTAAIAAAIGIYPSAVTLLERAAMRRGEGRGRSCGSPASTVRFPLDMLDRLAPHAGRRGIKPGTLARRIVETVIDEDLVDAVLDDLEELAELGEPAR